MSAEKTETAQGSSEKPASGAEMINMLADRLLEKIEARRDRTDSITERRNADALKEELTALRNSKDAKDIEHEINFLDPQHRTSYGLALGAIAYQRGEPTLQGSMQALERIKDEAKRNRTRIDARAMHFAERGLEISTFGAGGALLPTTFSGEIIPLLRDATVLLNAGVTPIPLSPGQQIVLGRVDQMATAYWATEKQEVSDSEPETSQIALSSRKLMVGLPVTGDMLAAMPAMAEMMARDAIAAMASKLDISGLTGTGATGQPKGVDVFVAPGNSNPSTGDTIAEINADGSKAQMKVLRGLKGNPLTNPAWIVPPDRKELMTGLTTDLGAYAFQSFQTGTPTWLGDRVILSTALADSAPIYFGAWAELLMGVTSPRWALKDDDVRKDTMILMGIGGGDFAARRILAFSRITFA